MTTVSTPAPVIWGVLARFDSPGALLRVARETCKAGYRKFDVYTPFPVHGMDQAMGLGRSSLGWIAVGGAVTGFLTAVGLQYYAVWDYPLIHQGKPYYAWQPYLVIMFELTVLFTAFACVLGMIFMNGLPRWYHPTLKRGTFSRVTDDGFYLSIEAVDPQYDPVKTRQFLEAQGAIMVEELEE